MHFSANPSSCAFMRGLTAGILAMLIQYSAHSESGVAVLLVDTDRVLGTVDERIYGHFLEHINHSVVDGLFAEQVRGQGFEAKDFETYWKVTSGEVGVVNVEFKSGTQSLRLVPGEKAATVRQSRFFIQAGHTYDGSVWLKPAADSTKVTLRLYASDSNLLAEVPLEVSGSQWQESQFSFRVPKTDQQATLELSVVGGPALIDFVSLMRSDLRAGDKLRPDLVEALDGLKAPFIRWPGGSFASIYKWRDGIGPYAERKYHPNAIWGDYADYYGFGTAEFMALCDRLDSQPMVVLPATTTDPSAVEYAMDWVRYLLDPPTTELGALRAANGHPEPYEVPYIQIDNEPMNHGLSPEAYAEIVNVYGSRLRKLAPQSRIVACGQKRSNDMIWSQNVIDLAGDNFDILGCHNYEYEPENYETGIRRIEDYLLKLREYVRRSGHPDIKIAVLEWNLSRTYDWRAGLHAAGSLMIYEQLSPVLEMTAPALLMRNIEDDPTWTAFIYHDHVSWFPGSAYVVQKLFREHYLPKYHASTSGTFLDLPSRQIFFDEIAQMKPEDWTPGTVDAIATGSESGGQIIIKAVNYSAEQHTLLTRIQGSGAPQKAEVRVFQITAGIHDAASLADPHKLDPVQKSVPFARDMAFELPPFTVAVVEIVGESNN